jgi:Glycosyl transferase family 41
MLISLLRQANATAKLFSRNVLRGPLGRKLKPWLRRLLKKKLRQLICKRQDNPESSSIRLPVEGLLAFLGIKLKPGGAQAWTIASITALLVDAMPGNPAVAGIYREIADTVDRCSMPKKPGISQKLVGLVYGIWTGKPLETTAELEIPVNRLFTGLAFTETDMNAIALRPIDIIVDIVANSIYLGHRIDHSYADLASRFSVCGHPALAVALLRRAFAISHDPQVHDRLLHAMMLAPDTSNQTMLEEAIVSGKLHFPENRKSRHFEIDRDPDKRLRIGYTCCFFYDLGTRIAHLPLMLGHDRSQFEVFAYSDEEVDDSFHVADTWRNTGRLNDDQFAQRILDDRIDILVEFNGRGGRSRFGAFAKRIAPVQMNFGNFPATTGIPQVDYTVAHSIDVPVSEDCFYTEKVARFDCMAVDYEQCWPKDFFPEVSLPPYKKNGYITFGCFGGSIKVNEKLIESWCDIVKRVPDSRLYFKSMPLSEPANMEAFLRMFARHGLSGNRLILEGASSHRAMLELYSRVDIALDTYPYNGGNTSLEALWQGIPVVTLKGNRWAARLGARFLIQAGLPRLIAGSWDEYASIAVEVATDCTFRDEFRKTSRDLLRKSVLFNMPLWIQQTETAYRQMWRDWLKTAK